MGQVSESIFSGESVVIPLADVQHIEKSFHSCDLVNGAKKGDLQGVLIITKHTKWDMEADTWANSIWLTSKQYEKFMPVWCTYRRELEIDTLIKMP